MRRWDRLQDAYLEEYRARGLSEQTVLYAEARLERWGRWLKKRRPRVAIEDIDAQTITQWKKLWIHVLPFLHLCACVLTVIANPDSGWKYVGLADYPVSIMEVGLSMRYDVHPFLFFGVIGTAWWYLISLVVFLLFQRLGAGTREVH